MPKCEECEERSKKSGGRPRESGQKVAATPAASAASATAAAATTVSSTTSQKSARQPKHESVRETLKVGKNSISIDD